MLKGQISFICQKQKIIFSKGKRKINHYPEIPLCSSSKTNKLFGNLFDFWLSILVTYQICNGSLFRFPQQTNIARTDKRSEINLRRFYFWNNSNSSISSIRHQRFNLFLGVKLTCITLQLRITVETQIKILSYLITRCNQVKCRGYISLEPCLIAFKSQEIPTALSQCILKGPRKIESKTLGLKQSDFVRGSPRS